MQHATFFNTGTGFNDFSSINTGRYRVGEVKKNHVIILGNGFDLFLNRKTRYKDFYKSKYCPKRLKAPLIQFLNEKYGESKNTRWCDIENQLFEYVQSSDFDKNDSKQDYKAFERIKQGLRNYMCEINTQPIDSLHLSILKEDTFKVSKNENREVFTFNYTSIPQIPQFFPHYTRYVHGSCEEDNIILGIYENKDLPEEYGFLQKNTDLKYPGVQVLKSLMKADIVTFFGHSLSLNDKQYYQEFFKRQSDVMNAKKNVTINFYTKDIESDYAIKYTLKQLADLDMMQQNCIVNFFITDELLKKYTVQ